jgi:hypothetical protein
MEAQAQLPQGVHLVQGVGLGGLGHRQGPEAGEDGSAGGTGVAGHPAGQLAEPVGVDPVGHVVLGPGVAALGEAQRALGRRHRRLALLPHGADQAGLEEAERGRHDVGVDVAEHAAAPHEVEVHAAEPQLRAPPVGGAVEHEVAGGPAHGVGGGAGGLEGFHVGGPPSGGGSLVSRRDGRG